MKQRDLFQIIDDIKQRNAAIEQEVDGESVDHRSPGESGWVDLVAVVQTFREAEAMAGVRRSLLAARKQQKTEIRLFAQLEEIGERIAGLKVQTPGAEALLAVNEAIQKALQVERQLRGSSQGQTPAHRPGSGLYERPKHSQADLEGAKTSRGYYAPDGEQLVPAVFTFVGGDLRLPKETGLVARFKACGCTTRDATDLAHLVVPPHKYEAVARGVRRSRTARGRTPKR